MHSVHIHIVLFARRCVARSGVDAPGRDGGCGGGAMQDRARRASSGSEHGAEADSCSSDSHLTDHKFWSASLHATSAEVARDVPTLTPTHYPPYLTIYPQPHPKRPSSAGSSFF
jgi:hypothetical protein